MRTLLTKREVADLLGWSERYVEMRSGDFATERSADTVRNGRAPLLYKLSSLPAEAQRKWAERQQHKVVEITPPAPVAAPGQMALTVTTPAGPNLAVSDREEAERRYRVIEPLILPEKHRGVWIQCAERRTAVVQYLASHHQVRPRTVYHWLKAWRDRGLPGLVTQGRADKGHPRKLNDAALDFLVAASLPKFGQYGTLTVAEIYRAYQEERRWRAEHADRHLLPFEAEKYARYVDGEGRLRPDAQLPQASYETFRSWFQRIPDVVRVMAREGEEAFSNTQEIISFRDLAEIQPLDYLVMDHRVLDIFCLVRAGQSGWKLARPWLTAAIDMRTRRWLAWAIVETPSSDSIASVLKRAFLDHGLPKAAYWDNGKDFRCQWLEGRQARSGEAYKVGDLSAGMRGVLSTLGVRVHHAIVKRARAKIIEPCFRAVAEFDRTLPWYCGHKPGARPEALERMVSQHERWAKGEAGSTPFEPIEQITALYDEFLGVLNEREHPGEGMRKVTPSGHAWMCPNECWERLIKGVTVRRPDPEAIQFCFHKRRKLRVRNGEVSPSFAGRNFHYRMADNGVALMALNGREVEFAYDPHDLGTAAVYCEDRFIGLAHNVELRRMGEEAFVQDERDRRAARREVKRFIQAVHSQVYVPDARERALRRAAVAPLRLAAGGEMDPSPMTVEAEAPEPIMAAVAAAREDREFSFAATAVDVVAAGDEAYRDDDADDGEFRFFKE